MKKLISLSLSAMLALGLAACSGQSDELVLTMGELALPDSSEATVDTVAQAVSDSLGGGFETIQVGTGDNSVSVGLSSTGVGDLASKADSGDEEAVAEWQALADSVTSVCSSIRIDLDDAGLTVMSIAFTVTNDLDSDYVLLTVQDGSVVFDVLDGFPGVDF